MVSHHAGASVNDAPQPSRVEDLRAAIFDQVAVGIAVSTLDGRLVEINEKCCEIFGYTADELRGRTFLDLTHPDDVGASRDAMLQLLDRSISALSFEKRYLRKDGSEVWSWTTVTLLRGTDGEPQRFIGVVEDMSARKRVETALQDQAQIAEKAAEDRKALLESERAARNDAERMSELKGEFLATLSHELRTPLNAIVGWAQILRTRPSDREQLAKGLETIERNARVQAQLIEDLLDMSRITSGKLRLDVQRLHPASVVEAAVETVRTAADAKGIRLEKVIDPSAGPISADPGRLQQVMWNLLSNAIKFTPRGGTVQVVLQCVDSHVELSVADTGSGVKPEFMPHLFERFRQGDTTTTRRHGGLGLGLSIVKSLVELHGGTVMALSPGDNQGTTITVHLPLTAVRPADDDRTHPAARRPEPTDFVSMELAGLTVLVVDDQPDARELILRVLEDCSARVLTAASADEALPLVESARPDVLISDIGMPVADGYELLRRVRELGPTRGGRVPAIALTAFARSEDRTRALRSGFMVHVSKPVDPSELVATVAAVAGRVSQSGEGAAR
jgi:PAS domain S-box-containing protein